MFVARFTDNPEADIKRGWSGWMGQEYPSPLDAAYVHYLGDDDNLELEELDEDEILDILGRNGYDLRYDEAHANWRICHHDGLSCWKLEAKTIEDAIVEAEVAPIDWVGFGYATVGTVRLVAKTSKENLYIFECDRVDIEN